MGALRQLGCDTVQGYLVSKPVSLAELRFAPVPVFRVHPTGAAGTRRQHQLIAAVTGLLAHETTSPGLPDDYVALVRTALAELLEATGLETVYLTRVNVEDGEQRRRPPARADHLCLGAHPAAQRGARRHAVRRGVDAAGTRPRRLHAHRGLRAGHDAAARRDGTSATACAGAGAEGLPPRRARPRGGRRGPSLGAACNSGRLPRCSRHPGSTPPNCLPPRRCSTCGRTTSGGPATSPAPCTCR